MMRFSLLVSTSHARLAAPVRRFAHRLARIALASAVLVFGGLMDRRDAPRLADAMPPESREAADRVLDSLRVIRADDPALPIEAPPDTSATFATQDTSLFPIIDFVPDTSFVPDTGLVFVIETGSRLYPGWSEEHRVRLGESFPIGDTEWSAAVTGFLPDFRLVDGRPVTASRAMNNPAAKVVARESGSAADSTWAFLNFPPHFSARSFFTFRLKQIVGMERVPQPGSAQ